MTNDESDRQERLGKLCVLILRGRAAHQVNDRAAWKASYYRKLLASGRHKKWTEFELERKIESARLGLMRTQEQLKNLMAETVEQLSSLRVSLAISFFYNEKNQIDGMWLPHAPSRPHDGIKVDMEGIQVIADQYEANKALSTVLEDNNES